MENKDAIEILNNYHNGYFGYKIDNVKKAHSLAIKALENQPRWIPVTERLPEDKTKVLITNKLGKVREILWNTWAQTEYQHEPDIYKAVAWMPLPEPYTKEETT